MSKTFLVPKMSRLKIFGRKWFCGKTVLGPKKFGLKKFGSFRINANGFLIILGKILGAERFGCKEVFVAFMLEIRKKIQADS